MMPPVVAPTTALADPGTVSVKIAVAAPLSAGLTTMGQGIVRGTQLAVADWESELTSAGVTITVQPFDDQGEPQTAVTNAELIRADSSILGVVGHLNSGCSIPASQIYHYANVAMVTPMSTNPYLTQQGLNNVFRTCATDTGQGPFAADIAVRNLGLTRAYVVDDDTPYGTSLADGFRIRFAANGGKYLGTTHTSDTTTNFKSLIKKIKKKKPNVIYYGGIYNAGGLFARQLRNAGVKAQLIGGDGLYDLNFISLAGSKGANGVIATYVGLPNTQLPGGAAFESRFASMFPGYQPLLADDAYAYDAAVAIIKAILAVRYQGGASALLGTSAREQVRARVSVSTFTGVTGRIEFDSAGDRALQQFTSMRVKSGVWCETAAISKPNAVSGYRTRNWQFLGSLSPQLPVGTHSVKAVVYRKSINGGYKRVKTVYANVSDEDSYRSVLLTPEVKLGRGSYYVFFHQDGNGLAPMDGPRSYFKVK
jgi:branched-chain amino acid transport system substrate-binding protein